MKYIVKKRNTNIGFIFDPLFYLALALLAGELSLNKFGIPISINSSMMYLLVITSIFLCAFEGKILRAKKIIRVEYLIYIYILVRNITASEFLFETYWLPNAITLLALFCVGNVLTDKKDINYFLRYIFWLSGAVVFMGFLKSFASSERLSIIGGPNGFYKFSMLFESLLFGKVVNNKNNFFGALCGIIAIITTILTGSKGAIIVIVVVLLFETFYYLKIGSNSWNNFLVKSFKFIYTAAILGLALVFYFNRNENFSKWLTRGISLFGAGNTNLTSVLSRQYLYRLAWNDFLDAPIWGHGAKSIYFETMGTVYAQPYAHNIFLEMLGEQGGLGFAIVSIAIIQVARIAIKTNTSNSMIFVVFLCFLVYLIGALFSGNILDFKMGFVFSLILKNLYEIDSNGDAIEE